MRQKEIFIDPVAVDPNGIAEAQAVAAAGDLSLNGALIVDGVFIGDYGRQISITSDGADGGRTFTVTGTDADGAAQTEDITGPATATVESAKYYKTITSIAADDACAGNISSGTVDEFVTSAIPLNVYNSEAATVSVERFTGTISISMEQTFSRVQYSPIVYQATAAALTNITAVAFADLALHASGVRLKANSYTTGAELTMVINQNLCGS